MCRSCNLKQLINSPTRITDSSSTLIDLIFSNSDHITHQESLHFGLSDHNIIFCVRKSLKIKYQSKTIKCRSFKNFNSVNYINDLQNLDWSTFYNSSDINEACLIFNQNICKIADSHAPFISIRVKGKSEPWVNEELRSAIKHRDHLHKVSSISKDSSDWKRFKIARNKVNKLKSSVKGKYYNDKIVDLKQKPKELWKEIKQLLPDSSGTRVDKLIDDEGVVIEDQKEICNSFNKFFVNIGSNLAKNFTSSTSDITVPITPNSFSFRPISRSEVIKILKSLDNNKSTGPDKINIRLLKEGANVISDKLQFLFNLSLSSGKVPNIWKIKRVSPLFKSGDKYKTGNYRPISIISNCMKIFEKLVYGQMISFIQINNILQPNQSGFRNKYSTSSASLEVKEHIVDCLSKNKYVCAVLVDLAKAFDTVDHHILLKKLFCYGFRDQAFDWLLSYLSERQQMVLLNNVLSDPLTEKSFGVPQGSVLGPLFFLLYINDISSALKFSYFHLYADDTIIVLSGNELESLKQSMEFELLELQAWLRLNKLTPNKKKCETIFFGNPQNVKKCSDIKISFGGETLQNKDTVKYLGVYFDSLLTWKKQISESRRKINYKLSKIRPLAKFLDPSIISLLIKAFIFPYINYCSTTCHSASSCSIKKLQSTCNKVNLLSPNLPIISVKDRLDHDLAILAFKIIHKTAPPYLCDKIQLTSTKHKYNTRQSKNNGVFHFQSTNKFSTKSIKYSIPHLWNGLPIELKNEKSLLCFKNKSKKYFKI